MNDVFISQMFLLPLKRKVSPIFFNHKDHRVFTQRCTELFSVVFVFSFFVCFVVLFCSKCRSEGHNERW